MITQRKAASNIRRVLEQVTPKELQAGADWYQSARESAEMMAEDFCVSVEVAAHIIAALSPAIRWETNVQAARKLLAASKLGTLDSVVLSGYPKNVEKAKRILGMYLSGNEYRHILKGVKVTEFAANILDPSRCHQVTLDTHAISISLGKRFTTKSAPELRLAEFTRVSAAYVQVAAEYNITPNQCQAISWLVWRRLHSGRKGKK